MIHLDVVTFIFLLALLALGYRLKAIKHWNDPALPISHLAPFLGFKSWRVTLAGLSQWLFWASLFFVAVALSHPRMVQEVDPQHSLVKTEIPRSGVALYFLLDESGSMIEKVTTQNDRGSRIEIPKIDLAKQSILEFVEGKQGLNLPGRKDDLVGLIAFARVPEVLCPLTLNRQEIKAKLSTVQPIQDDARNGTAIGYAIFKAVNIIVATKHFADRQQDAHKSVYSITNQAIIIITDGLQSPHPDDKDNPFRFMPPDEAINYAKDNGVRVFYIGIDPTLASSDYANDVAKMKKSMQGSGGELFLANAGAPIEDILAQIDKMEKSALPPQSVLSQNPVREVSLVGFFVLLALISLGAACLLETTIVRAGS